MLLLVAAVGYFLWSSSKKKKQSGAKEHRRQSDDSASSDDAASTGTGSGSSDDDDDDEKPRKKHHSRHGEDYSLAKLDALQSAERDAVADSIYSAAARNPFGLRGALADQGRAPMRSFELAKGSRPAMSSSGSDSEAGQRLLRSRRGSRAFDSSFP